MIPGAHTAASEAPFALAQGLDMAALAAAFAAKGRLHIPGILERPAAERIHGALMNESDWSCATLAGGQAWDIPLREMADWSPDRLAHVLSTADWEAVRGFHFMFDSLRLTALLKAGRPVAPVYRELCAFLSGPEFLAFIHALTGDDRVRHADAQATRFRPGHYLNAHDDDNRDYARLYAYVLNLTPGWRADFGGLLTFIDPVGHVSEAYTPTFNALNIFRVPLPHAVTPIARFAPGGRLSITGWLRQDEPPVYP